MKFSAFVVLSALSNTSAFVAPNANYHRGIVTQGNAVAEAAVEAGSKTSSEEAKKSEKFVDPRTKITPGRYDDISYSLAVPILPKPSNLDGSHAGDFGFDPLGLSQEFDLYYMQECELRHARLAMLAVVGWPLQELIAPKFMLQDGCSPSVLNGMNPFAFLGILTVFGAFGFLESQTAFRKTTGTKLGDTHTKDLSDVWKWGVAGDYDFDPAGLYSSLGDDAHGRKGLRQLEVTQGRYAMLGITYFAAWEALTGNPIVENNPFFHPNGMLPVLAVAYWAWSQVYQVSDIREYPIQIEYTKDGEDILRNIKRTSEGISKDYDLEPVLSKVSPLFDKVGELTKSLQK